MWTMIKDFYKSHHTAFNVGTVALFVLMLIGFPIVNTAYSGVVVLLLLCNAAMSVHVREKTTVKRG